MNRVNRHSEVISYTAAGDISKHAFIGVLPNISEQQIFWLLRCKFNSSSIKLEELANKYKRQGRPLTEEEQTELIELASTGSDAVDNRRFKANYDYMMIEFKEQLGSYKPYFKFSTIPHYSLLAVSTIIRLLNEDPLALSNYDSCYKLFHKLAAPGSSETYLRFNFVEEYNEHDYAGTIRPRIWYKDTLNISTSMY